MKKKSPKKNIPQQEEDEYIIIPNPIYDVVFRYLMEDTESAKIVISTIINQKIKTLIPEPLTHTEKDEALTDPQTNEVIRLFHLDFTAIIELSDGTEEMVMIELQKASEPDDIFRFKRYIMKNFQKKRPRTLTDPRTGEAKEIDVPIRLIPIFILNFRIENQVNDLVIATNRVKTGIFKNHIFTQHNEFIDHLSYDMYVVQLPNLYNIKEEEYLHDEYKRNLYSLLKLFDQKSVVRDNQHRLRLIRRFLPGFLERVVKRLQIVSSQKADLEEKMYIEDEYLKVLEERDNVISYLQAQVEEKQQALEEKDKALEQEKQRAEQEKQRAEQEKQRAEQEKQRAEQEKQRTEQEKQRAEQEKQRAEQEKQRAEQEHKKLLETAKLLLSLGVSIEIIKEKTGLTQEEIEKL